MSSSVEYAIAYQLAGWHPIPVCQPRLGADRKPDGCHHHGGKCKSPGKVPLLTDWPGLRNVAEETIRAWGSQFGEFNIGVLLGRGTACLDVDPRNGGAASFEQLELEHGPLSASVRQVTPSCGWHQLGCYDAMRLGRVTKYDPLPGLNFLADGCFIVVAPSIHVRTLETGVPYVWEDQEELPRIADLREFPDWLVQPEPARERHADPGAGALPQSEARRIGSALFQIPPEADGTWLTALMAVKTASGEAGYPVFDAWSRTTSAGNYDPIENRKRWDSIKVGDGTSATINEETLFWLARQHGWTDPQGKLVEDKKWTDPISFDDGPRPAFPLRCLGPRFADYADGLAVAYQVPVDLPALLALATVAAAVAKKFAVRVCAGWIEALTLYIAVALMPGERKSPTLSRIVEPLAAWERAKAKEFAEEIKARTRQWEDAQARVKALRTKVANAGEDAVGGLREQLEQAYLELDSIQLLVAPRARIDDTTPEALGRVIFQNGGRIAALSSEGGLFETLAGRYNDGVANLDLILKGWDGRDEWMRDRVGDAPMRVRSPIVTLGFAVQPDVVRGMANKSGFRGRGLIGRFLFSVPTSLMGSRDIGPQPLRPELQAWWTRTLTHLLELPENRDDTGEIETTEIPLSPSAERLIQQFNAEIEPRLGEDGDLRPLSDWAGKLVGTTARVAGLLHLVDEPGNEARAVSADAARRAIELASYLIEHAKVALEIMGADAEIERARDLLRWIRRRGTPMFTSREALDGLRRQVRRMEFVDQALAVLEEREYVREVETLPRKQSGRKPSATWEVNPWVFTSSGSSAESAQPVSGARQPQDPAEPSAESAHRDPVPNPEGPPGSARSSAESADRDCDPDPDPKAPACCPEPSAESAQPLPDQSRSDSPTHSADSADRCVEVDGGPTPLSGTPRRRPKPGRAECPTSEGGRRNGYSPEVFPERSEKLADAGREELRATPTPPGVQARPPGDALTTDGALASSPDAGGSHA